MTRIFGAYAYSDGPRRGCWWDETCTLPDSAPLAEDLACDVAVVGGGFTGLNAALRLAQAGRSVAVFEAARTGWGASGRNGGFCCLGGGMLSDDALDRRFGMAERLAFRRAEVDAIHHVERLIQSAGMDVDRHSQGETQLAHRARDFAAFEAEMSRIEENYGASPILLDRGALRQHGMGSGYFGALSVPIGFALNPRKYLRGLAGAVRAAGVRIFEQSAVTAVQAGPALMVNGARVRARDVIIATNGYSSEDIPRWLGARYMPAQSNVLVTRPLTDEELSAQGWTSEQMAFDSRNLLHYFRLMPDRRFLFGMRGGLRATPGSEVAARRRLHGAFGRIFPAWRGVKVTHAWSGMVALSRGRMPYLGPVPGQPGLWAALCYHGNGVAMASYCGRLLADRILGKDGVPVAMSVPLSRFPLGRARRLLMPPIYAALSIADR